MSGNEPATRWSRPGPRTLVIAGLAVAAIVAAVVIAFVVTRSPEHSSARAKPTVVPLPTCGPAGCAVVSVSHTLPRVTIFYGASCSGVYGSWFFNAVEGGGNDQLRPSYALRWSFAPGSAVAKPGGHIDIPSTDSTQVTITLNQGTLSLTGTRKPNVKVAATGTLVVQLSGSTTAPVLMFTETGLQQAESSLGLLSPFNVDGSPLTVPVKTVKTMVGC